jgi:hypothetical protein
MYARHAVSNRNEAALAKHHNLISHPCHPHIEAARYHPLRSAAGNTKHSLGIRAEIVCRPTKRLVHHGDLIVNVAYWRHPVPSVVDHMEHELEEKMVVDSLRYKMWVRESESHHRVMNKRHISWPIAPPQDWSKTTTAQLAGIEALEQCKTYATAPPRWVFVKDPHVSFNKVRFNGLWYVPTCMSQCPQGFHHTCSVSLRVWVRCTRSVCVCVCGWVGGCGWVWVGVHEWCHAHRARPKNKFRDRTHVRHGADSQSSSSPTTGVGGGGAWATRHEEHRVSRM